MVTLSASIPHSTPFLGPNSTAGPPPPRPPPTSVRLRRSPPRVTAACATATTSRPHAYIATSASLYEVLGVQMGANCQEIKAAYRRLARVLHPDVVASDGEKDASADDFMRIHAAYSTLSDPQKRADYDRTLFRTRMTPLSLSSLGFCGYTRRNWETDQCW